MSSPAPPLNAHSYTTPLTPEQVHQWFDSDGRLVKEAEMRKALFEVGVHPSCRRRLFKFLFGIYPINSTTRDRRTIDIENRANYIALRRRWEIMDRTITFPDDDLIDSPFYMEFSDDEEGDDSNSRLLAPTPTHEKATPLDNSRATPTSTGGVAVSTSSSVLTESRDSGNFTETSLEEARSEGSLCSGPTDTHSGGGRGEDTPTAPKKGVAGGSPRENGGRRHHPSSDTITTSSAYEHHHGNSSEGGVASSGRDSSLGSSPIPPSSSEVGGGAEADGGRGLQRRLSTCGVLDEEGQALLKILEFPAKVYAARLSVDLEKSYPRAKRIILRDVSRTDRNYHFFTHKRNLRRVHRILMIFSLFHPEIGYAQGMNDILARFLVMTDSEVDSYWLFKRYMDSKQKDFLEDTMMAKVELVKNLIYELDSTLFEFFENSECKDYLFCHRWLLLDFKREFPFEESLRVFEVVSSHYLELNSDKALLETDKVIAKEFELDGGEMRARRSAVNLDFTFDLFICAAILTMSGDIISKGTDAASIYGYLNGLSMNLDLNKVLHAAEYLFYKYCKLTVTRGFSDIQLWHADI